MKCRYGSDNLDVEGNGSQCNSHVHILSIETGRLKQIRRHAPYHIIAVEEVPVEIDVPRPRASRAHITRLYQRCRGIRSLEDGNIPAQIHSDSDTCNVQFLIEDFHPSLKTD